MENPPTTTRKKRVWAFLASLVSPIALPLPSCLRFERGRAPRPLSVSGPSLSGRPVALGRTGWARHLSSFDDSSTWEQTGPRIIVAWHSGQTFRDHRGLKRNIYRALRFRPVCSPSRSIALFSPPSPLSVTVPPPRAGDGETRNRPTSSFLPRLYTPAPAKGRFGRALACCHDAKPSSAARLAPALLLS